jgi:hypothetical protein
MEMHSRGLGFYQVKPDFTASATPKFTSYRVVQEKMLGSSG